MRLVFAGTPDVAVPSLETLLDSPHEVAAVVTRPDARAGRGRTLHPSPVKARAAEAGIEVLTPTSARDPEFLARLARIAPDACPVVAYGNLVPPPALAVPRLGWVNLHFSLLPAWRGAAPVQRAIIAGDETTGASAFVLDEGLDTGPVVGTLTEPIRPDDTAGDLLDRLARSGAALLVRSLEALDAGTTPTPQTDEGASHAAKLSVEDARVDWSTGAATVDRLVRGCTPAPGAWTTFRGERLKLAPVRPVDAGDVPEGSTLAPGELRAGKREVLVGTADGVVALTRVQPQGKKQMDAADWARGVRVGAEERFDS